MSNQAKKWEIIDKSLVVSHLSLVDILLKNRGIKSKKDRDEFLNPPNPLEIGIKELGISDESVKKAIVRIKKAKKNKEFVIIYGDYDADGITATAILWESLHEFGLDVLPFIPDRFEDGYGIKSESVSKLKMKFPNLSLIITVDNGIVAYEGIKKAGELGIDTIIVDHHQKGPQTLDSSFIIHNSSVCGSALAWFFCRELIDHLKNENLLKIENCKLNIVERLGLAAIGTVADQMPLTGINRSIVKFGLTELENTKRPGLVELFRKSGLKQGSEPCSIGTYEINYIIAPRINAMGRLKNGIESLRLLCTRSEQKALEIAENVGETNRERQKMVEEVLTVAMNAAAGSKGKIIVVSGENYHEGVIGLAAGKLVEEFYRPSIVFSINGDTAKASARSISGFNIIEAVRHVNLHLEGGGHPMAAGFSIKTSMIEKFTKEINKYAGRILTDNLLEKKIKIDCYVDFEMLNKDLVEAVKDFEPFGLGNFEPILATRGVELLDVKVVGRDSKHLKLKLKQNEHILDSIFFGGGEMYSDLTPGSKIDVAYNVEENIWNGYKNIQLRIKDLKL